MRRHIFWVCVNLAALWLLAIIVMVELSAWDIALAHQPEHWWADRVAASILGIATLLIVGSVCLALIKDPPPTRTEASK